MKEENVICFLSGFVVGLIIGFCCSFLFTLNNIRYEAVRVGVAEYYIETNTFNREFRWIAPEKNK